MFACMPDLLSALCNKQGRNQKKIYCKKHTLSSHTEFFHCMAKYKSTQSWKEAC